MLLPIDNCIIADPRIAFLPGHPCEEHEKNIMRQIPWILLAATGWLSISVLASAASDEGNLKIPDFTKGDTVPTGAKHDWNLGPTGLRGWMFSDKLVTKDARQILITAVDAGSPADGIIAVGDVLTGVHGKPFSFDPRTEFGQAITAAEMDSH